MFLKKNSQRNTSSHGFDNLLWFSFHFIFAIHSFNFVSLASRNFVGWMFFSRLISFAFVSEFRKKRIIPSSPTTLDVHSSVLYLLEYLFLASENQEFILKTKRRQDCKKIKTQSLFTLAPFTINGICIENLELRKV